MEDIKVGIYFLILIGLGMTPWFDLQPLCLGGSIYFILSGIYFYWKEKRRRKTR